MDIRCFTKSMLHWAKLGFKLVTYREYWRRRQICKNCSMDWPRCPICGCWLWAYCRLKTSACKNWRTIEEPWDLEVAGISYRINPTEE